MRNRKKGNRLNKNTINYIISIVVILYSIFNFLAIFGWAGKIGDLYYIFLGQNLLGISAYFIISLVLFSFGIRIFDNSYNFNLDFKKIIAFLFLIIFLIGFFGLLDIGASAWSVFIYSPVLFLFGKLFSVLIFFSLILISLIIIFSPENLKQYLKEKIINMFELIKKINRMILILFERKKENDLADEEEVIEEKMPDKKVKETKEIKKETSGLFKKFKKEEKKETKNSIKINFKNTKNNLLPPIDLLEKAEASKNEKDILENAEKIKKNLANFKIEVEVEDISVGPSITRFSLRPASGVRIAKIGALQNDLSLALAAHPLRIEAPIPGKSLIGIEIPNKNKQKVALRELIESIDYQESAERLLIALGKDIEGKNYFYNLSKAPHILIAGTTGSGKSVAIHNLVCSLIYRNSPEKLKFIFSDPKKVELTLYENIPHLLTPVITDAKNTILGLKWAIQEMERRYDIFEKEKVRDLISYENKAKSKAELEQMPRIVIFIDELADIMQTYPKELESSIVRLAQKSRATGIHLVLSTQRPSVNVITGLIKANIPTRIALKVSSQIDSRTILDSAGAEKLLGFGDMLFASGQNPKPIRVQSPFIDGEEIKKIVEFLIEEDKNNEEKIELTAQDKNTLQESQYINNEINFDEMEDSQEQDELYKEAVEFVIGSNKASTSYLQRKFKIGYSRAARLMDMMEEKNIIGPANGSKPREILINKHESD